VLVIHRGVEGEDGQGRLRQLVGPQSTPIDAALELRELIALDDIARIDVAITNFAARRLTDKYPQTEESAKFSGPYLAAYTLVHGAPMLAAFTEEALHDDVATMPNMPTCLRTLPQK
jgi:2-methylcitrate dehydratase PrpD